MARAGIAAIVAILIPGLAASEVPPAIAAQVLDDYRKMMGGPSLHAAYLDLAEKPPYHDVIVERDQRYGAHPRQQLDSFRATAASAGLKPVLLFMHGGAFKWGDKSLGPDGKPSPFFDNVPLWAARHGMVGINIRYMLAPQARYPDTQAEIGEALRWIAANAARLGADPKRIFIMGHSSGAAQLALYVGHPDLHPSGVPEPAGAILVSGLYDDSMPMTGLDYPGNGEGQAYLSNDPARIALANPLPGLLLTSTPLLIVTAQYDPELFHDQARLFAEARCTVGRCVERVALTGHNHSSEIMAINTADHGLTDRIEAFVAANGGTPR